MSANHSKRLLLSDLDGTLVGKDFAISDRVKNALHSWKDAGNAFTIITGRSYTGKLESICQELALKDPIVARGGAEIIDPVSGNILKAVFLDDMDAEAIISLFSKHHLHFEVGKGDYVYSSTTDQTKLDAWKTYKPLKELQITQISKIRLFAQTEEEKVMDLFVHEFITQKLPNIAALKAANQFSFGYDITSEKATKYMAALEMMKIMGFVPQQTIGIGDGDNDYPLLTATGYKIALENGPQELKDIADLIVPTEEEDGVAVAIEKLLEAA